MKLKILLFTLFAFTAVFAQENATIKGKVTDREMNNETLPFASVMVKGTKINTTTDENGAYELKVAAGTHTLTFNFMGYEQAEVKVTVAAGENKVHDQVLKSTSVTLQDVVIEKTVSRQVESALLLEQKNSVEIKQNIGAQELSRKGVTDVATAVTKTTGITKQEGSGNIYVRGLGDRYNSTTMNGLPIPSNNASKKNITLEIFPTQIVEFVSIDKVYQGKLYGDFAGGNVDIISKDYKGNGFFRVDIGSNINTNAVTDDNFKLNQTPGAFGFTKIDYPSTPLTNYSYESLNMEKKTPFAGSIGISGGDSFNVGEDGRLSFFATGSIGNEYLSITDGLSWGNIAGSGLANQRFDDYRSYNYGTNTTAMANIGYKINSRHKVNFNTLFINTSSQQTEEYRGYAADFSEDGLGFIRRNSYVKTNLWINQLLGEHKITDRFQANWAVSHNTTDDDMPDRTQNKMKLTDAGYIIFSQSSPDNHRYFQYLTEKETAAMASVDYKFGKNAEEEFNGKLTLGYNGRIKKRDFEATQYNFRTEATHRGDIVDPDNLDLFYNPQNFANNYFEIVTFRGGAEISNALVPQTYNGDLTIHAGFAQAEYKFSSKFTAVVGLRAEKITQKVKWDTQLKGEGEDEFTKDAFLPSLIMKYSLNEKHNLRFGFSKTYTLPQFKEVAPFVYEEVTQVFFGNENLYASDNYNVDLKWEMFPSKDEIISFTAFGKLIQNPINETVINSATNDISYLNTGDSGYAIGAEAEIRKTLYEVEADNAKRLTGGLNVSYLKTEQDLDKEKVEKETDLSADFTHTKSKFTGASDWLINADISYFWEWNQKDSNITATLAYNYFSDRIYSLGTLQRGDLVDKAVGTLDFILKSKINKNMGISLSGKNLLNPTIERVQENAGNEVVARSYKKGLFFSIGINYQL